LNVIGLEYLHCVTRAASHIELEAIEDVIAVLDQQDWSSAVRRRPQNRVPITKDDDWSIELPVVLRHEISLDDARADLDDVAGLCLVEHFLKSLCVNDNGFGGNGQLAYVNPTAEHTRARRYQRWDFPPSTPREKSKVRLLRRRVS